MQLVYIEWSLVQIGLHEAGGVNGLQARERVERVEQRDSAQQSIPMPKFGLGFGFAWVVQLEIVLTSFKVFDRFDNF